MADIVATAKEWADRNAFLHRAMNSSQNTPFESELIYGLLAEIERLKSTIEELAKDQ